MKQLIRALCVLATLGLAAVLVAVPALAGVRPSVTGLSSHRTTYWGGSTITVHGHNFTHVRKVMFGARRGHDVHVRSSTTLTVHSPYHGYGTTYVRVVTSSGWSAKGAGNRITFTHPTMNSHIQGGLTGRQEQRISARVRRAHHGVHTAPRSSHWTAAMGVTALRRARSWMGVPYSWAGGSGSGPTTGVCAHNGGDMDCHIIGFDCSGLALYSWWPYVHLVHYAATQRHQAGRFHPTTGQLTPGDLVYFSDTPYDTVNHTAIYEGNGNVIQAEESGTVVMRTPLRTVIAFSGAYRGATRPMTSGRQAPGPTVRSVTAKVPAGGGSITITGSQLATATSVVVGGKMLYGFPRRSASSVTLRVPAHRAGRVSVAVSNSWGTATTALTYVAAPSLTALTPAQGPTTGGTAVTLTGSGFTGVTAVHVGAAAVAFHVIGAGQLGITMPAHLAGTVPVRVTATFGTSNARNYLYLSPAPPSTTPPKRTTPSEPPTSGSSSPPSSPPSSSPSATSPTPTPSDTAPATGTPTPSAASTPAGGGSGSTTAAEGPQELSNS